MENSAFAKQNAMDNEKSQINTNPNSFLETEKIGTLMRRFALPCIISLLVGALYNIVDQIFIANADYLGSFGNAANTVVYPFTVIALAVATMIGDGCCAFVSLSLGANNSRKRTQQHRKFDRARLCGRINHHRRISVICRADAYRIRRKCQYRNICYVKRIFLLDNPRNPVLYVRSGDEFNNTFRRKPRLCHGGFALGGNMQYYS